MEKLFPRALVAGDEIAVLAPASGVRDEAALQNGLDRFRAWGLKPALMPHARARSEAPDGCPVAASDAERLADLQDALANPRYRAVVSVRGGYGVTRLLPDLDLAALASDPKPVLGYSDLTALLAAVWAETGVVGFHGPMLATPAAMDAGPAGWTLQRRLLTETAQPVALPAADAARGLCPGTAEGPLVGGNLSLVQCLVGTRWQIATRGALLFLEDVGEAPYRVDRILTHLQQTGALSHAAGIVLGDFRAAGMPPAAAAVPPPAMAAVLQERLAPLGVPVAWGFPVGHLPGSWTLPYGGGARLVVPDRGARATLELLEPAVRA